MGEEGRAFRFSAESITPLIISGADNNSYNLEKEGLRPPSMRGALRWWFRAVMACIIDEADRWETLRNLESTVFGSTGQQSLFQIRAMVSAASSTKAYVRMNDPNDLVLPNGKSIRSPTRSSLRTGSSFQLQFNLYDPRISPIVLGSFWLLAMLSGVGARTRRGFGSFLPTPQEAYTLQAFEGLKLPLQLNGDVNNASSMLASGIANVRNAFARYARVSPSKPGHQHFPSLCKDQCKCCLVTKDDTPWTKWEDCMNDLRDDVYRGFKAELSTRDLGKLSPLHIQVKRFSEGGHYGVLTAFQYERLFGQNWTKLDVFLKGLHNYKCAEVMLP